MTFTVTYRSKTGAKAEIEIEAASRAACVAECKARGAYLLGVTTEGRYNVEDSVNFTIYVPRADEHFVGSLAVIPLQLLGYYISVAKGLDVDKPRNLAKSVTVE